LLEKESPSVVVPSGIKRMMEGIVIMTEIGSWAGFQSGRITIKCENDNRIDFRYGKDSDGIIPEIGDFVSVQNKNR
jgi:hypothetical protein